MKLKFMRQEDGEVEVKTIVGSSEIEFDYVKMLEYLLSDGQMGEPALVGEFSEEERKSIFRMVDFINQKIRDLESGEV